MSVYIDETFRTPVRTHILANLVAESPEFPLILGSVRSAGERQDLSSSKSFAGISESLSISSARANWKAKTLVLLANYCGASTFRRGQGRAEAVQAY